MVEDGLGLPDGFLMDINNYLFTDLADSPHTRSPATFVDVILRHASTLFEKLTSEIRPLAPSHSSTPSSSYRLSASQNFVHLVSGSRFNNLSNFFSSLKPQVRPHHPNPIMPTRTPGNSSSRHGNDLRNHITPDPALDGNAKRKRAAFSYAEPEFGESRLATTTLLKQISILRNMDTRFDGFTAVPNEENLYIWTVRLYFDDQDAGLLAADLSQLKDTDHVQLEFRFPSAYPNVPPVVRVVSPFLIGGHVAPHGGLCMELLTTSGWAPVNSIDAVCIQIRTMLLHGNARVGFTKLNSVRNYTFQGALNDMRNIVRIHRWDTADPKNSRRKVLRS